MCFCSSAPLGVRNGVHTTPEVVHGGGLIEVLLDKETPISVGRGRSSLETKCGGLTDQATPESTKALQEPKKSPWPCNWHLSVGLFFFFVFVALSFKTLTSDESDDEAEREEGEQGSSKEIVFATI